MSENRRFGFRKIMSQKKYMNFLFSKFVTRFLECIFDKKLGVEVLTSHFAMPKICYDSLFT